MTTFYSFFFLSFGIEHPKSAAHAVQRKKQRVGEDVSFCATGDPTITIVTGCPGINNLMSKSSRNTLTSEIRV